MRRTLLRADQVRSEVLGGGGLQVDDGHKDATGQRSGHD